MTSPSQIKPVRQMIVAGFAIALLAVAGMGIFFYWKFSELNENLDRLTQPRGYVLEMEELLLDLQKSEVGLRNFAIRRQSNDSTLVMAFGRMYKRRADNLRLEAGADSALVEKTEQLEQLANQKFVVMSQIIQEVNRLDQQIFWKRLQSQINQRTDELQDLETPEREEEQLKELQQTATALSGDSSLARQMATWDHASWLLILDHGFFPLQQAVNAESSFQALLSKDEALSKQLLEVVDAVRKDLLEKTLDTNEAGSFETEFNRSSIWLFSTIILVVCLLLLWNIFQTLDRNRQLQEQLGEEKARAEKLAKAKEEFLANMSHEIRTPMHALIGFSEQLAGTRLNQRQKDLLRPIRHAANYLLALINDVLDYSKLESGAFRLESTAFQPKGILEEVVQALTPGASAKGIQLNLTFVSELPSTLLGDPLRLRQMLFNLIGNAIKFTEEGDVSVQAELKKEESGNPRLYIRIQDTGIGIPPERLETIFSKFEQGDSSTTRKYGGTGLGLPITQKLAQMHGGSLTVESKEGQGTTVHLKIPYQVGEQLEEHATEVAYPDRTEHLKGMRVLLADDEPFNRQLVEVMLAKWDVELDMVSNGKEVLEKLQEGKTYDLMLLDLQMPEMDGFETTRYIRQELKLDTPILAFTATSSKEKIAQARTVGMNAHLLKPFQEGEMLDFLHRWQELSQQEDQETQLDATWIDTSAPSASSVPTQFEDMSGPTYQLNTLYHMANQNPDMVAKMLHLFVDRIGPLRKQWVAAIDQGNFDTIGKLAHKLIPSCRHLEMNQLVGDLKQIETQAEEGKLAAEDQKRLMEVLENLESAADLIQGEITELEK
ncbi:MAG: ATP-binding protein [Bacteroidota bacterium]